MGNIITKKIAKSIICLVLSLALVITAIPADYMAAAKSPLSETTSKESNGFQISSQILSLENEYTSVQMSGENGGFYISNVEGDKTIKSDNNKELLYHSDDYDTSFTSFKITRNGKTAVYIFGEDYSYEGIETSKVTVLKDKTGLSAKWTLGDLEFTQRLELANSGSNEHGMVCITYNVKNNGTDNVSIEARMLLDSAIGNQDFAYYELPDTSYSSNTIEKECVIKGEEIPATFYAYDDLKNPQATASTVISSKGMLKQIAFAHWNSIAATDFDFAPNESLDFTNEGNDQYGTADSAMAMYYDLGTVNAGKQGIVNTYYGVFSNEKVKPEINTVAFNITAPATLSLSTNGKNYVSNCNKDTNGKYKEDGIFNIQTSLKNISDKENYDEVVVAAYASEGLTPLDEHQQKLSYETSYAKPYRCSYVDFKKGTNINIPFYFKADVDTSATYRKITFRVYKITSKTDSNLLYENMLYEGSTYVLCPGGNGKLPEITFNSASPKILYNDLSRHLYITGKNFSMLEDKSRYTLYAKGEDTEYKIPSSNITVYGEENKIDVLFNEKMKPGTYKLVFDWIEPPAGVDKKTTGDALSIVMSDDIKYRNDYYGLLAVVQEKNTKGDSAKYNIESFSDETEYEKNKSKYEEVLLLFKGDFIKDDTYDKGEDGENVKYVAKSLDGDKDKIVINGCIDALDGTITLTKKDGEINTDFDDVTLNASVENTRIYKGNAGFTSIVNGEEYSLVPYNTNGEELEDFEDQVITLVYPTALNGLMTIAGMAFNLSFARLGMMYDTDEENAADVKEDEAKGFVMSFSASLDLSFLIPVSKRNAVTNDDKAAGSDVFSDTGAKASDLRSEWNKTYSKKTGTSGAIAKNKKDKEKTKGTVQVKNVLYGMNRGFIGVNFDAEIEVPGYTDSMPNIVGKLEVNTINNWSFSVEGNASFLKSITLEVKLGFKSHNNVPIVDNLYFYIQGIKPGINLDSVGVSWLMGGGGGFENMYDTLFCASEVPPIRLLLSVNFGLFQALDARADLSLGLTGFGVKISDLKVSNTNIVLMDYANIQVDWIPYYKMLVQCSIEYLGIIEGKGYIVVDTSTGAEEAFEAYAKAGIKIPDAIPLIGGIEVGNAALGLNTTRIWGALKVLGFSTGICYVYGGDLSFGSQANVEPTYPQYLEEAGTKDINGRTWYPVGYDENKKDTLYMSLGSNIRELSSSDSGNLLADDSGNANSNLHSDITKKYHDFTLGSYEDGGAQVLSVSFSSESLEQAEEAKEVFSIKDSNDKEIALKYYDNSKSDVENEDANANFSYDKDKKQGTIVVSFTDRNLYNKMYKVNTKEASELILYAVDPLPEVNDISMEKTEYSNTDNKVTINWDGNANMSELEKMDIYVTNNTDIEKDGGTLVASLTKGEIAKKTATINLPETLTAGKYYIRAVYSKEDVTTGIVNTKGTFEYKNQTQPEKITNITAMNAGDLQLKASVDSKDDKCAGALFKVYEVNEKGEKTELSDYSVSATKNQNNEIYAILGGSSDSSTEDTKGKNVVKKNGLKANGKYIISATPFNKVVDENNNVTGLIYGEETFSNDITLNEPNKATLTLSANQKKYQVGRVENVKDENGNVTEKTVMYDTYDSSNINFVALSDMDVTGTWTLDGDKTKTGTFTKTKSIPVELTNISDGDHTINIYGKNENGDGFNESFVFNVDTTAPTLLLKSPTNGSGFDENGTLNVSGITEEDAYITVNINNEPVIRQKTLKDLNAKINEEGDFSFDVNIGSGYYKKNVEIIVSDEIGNSTKAQCEVYNNGMGNVKDIDVALSADTTDNTDKEWVSYSNKNLFLNEKGDTSVEVQLKAITNNDNYIILNDMDNVQWNVESVLGSSEITGNKLTIKNGSHGFVEGRLVLLNGAALSASFTYGAEIQGQTEKNGYKIVYNANGGKGAMTDPNSPYEKYDSVLVPKCGFTYSGKTFVSWNTKKDGTGTTYMPGDKFYISSNITLYAIWKNSSSGGNVTPTDKQQVKIGSTHTIGKNKYRVTSTNTVTYIGSTNKNTTKLVIPDSIKLKGKTYKVTAIGANVCKNCKKLTSVLIGKNVSVIAAKAFYKKKKLKNIKFKSTKVPKIGKNAFKRISKKAVFKVPKKVRKKYKKKLNKKIGFVKKTMKVK